MRTVFAECSVEYSGRLDAYLERSARLIMLKADGSVLIHSDGGSYKPLNWMNPPCTFTESVPGGDGEGTQAGEPGIEADAGAGTGEADAGLDGSDDAGLNDGVETIWTVQSTKTDDRLVIRIYRVLADYEHDLGEEPGLVKDGVEAHLQKLLAEQVERIGSGCELVRREYPTAIGPVDLMVLDGKGGHIAVEIKRRGEIDGVEQLTRYLELLGRNPQLQPLRGVFAAQEIKPQARTLAEDRGIECLVLDYDEMRGIDHPEDRLF